MSTDVTVETTVARPRPDVAAWASDPANDMRWIGALESVRVLGAAGEKIAVGDRVERVARFLGRRIRYVNEVVEHEPDRRLAMRSVEGPFPMTVVYEWEDAGAGTRMRIRAGGDASGVFRVAGPLLAFMVRRGVARDLRRLRRALESGR